jgi:hypothetical protein
MKYSKVWSLVTALLLWLCPPARSQQLPEVVKDGVRMYAPDKPFLNLQCVGPACSTAGTPAAIALSPAPTLCTTGSFATGIDANGNALGCALPGGVSVSIKFLSVNCPAYQNSDANAGGGTDGTACINALFAAASPTNPVIVWQDKGFTLIGSSGTGIQCPPGGNCTLTGNGGGIARTYITNCSISGGVATFTTKPNTLTAGQVGTLANLTNCPSITNTTVTVLSAGLSSTQFEVAASGTVSSGAENASFNQVYGTGFYLATGANVDAIANGNFVSGGGCGIAAAAPKSQGSNIHLSNFVINGNANGQSNYCFGAHIKDIDNFSSQGVVYYNCSHFCLTLDNVSDWLVEGNTFFSSSTPIGTNTDGVHVDGPSTGGRIANNYFKTGDDAIALNAVEGYCGPINSVAITNNVFDNAFTAMRMYNEDTNACGNGLVPLISYVDWNNNNGTVASHPFIFGLGGPPYESGSLNPAISHVHISNSSFNNPGSAGVNVPFYLAENIDDLSISNFTEVSPNDGILIEFGPGTCIGSYINHYNRISLTDVTIANTAQGSAFQHLYDNSSNCLQIGTLTVHGFGTTWEGISPSTQGPLIQSLTSPSTMNYLMMTDVDPTNLSMIGGLAGIANVSAQVPGGYVTSGAIASNVSPITEITTTTAAFSSTFTGNETFMSRTGSSATTFTLPPLSQPGMVKCAQHFLNDSGTLKIQASAGEFINDMAGNQTSSGGYIISSGTYGDAACVQSVAYSGPGNQWMMISSHGTWTVH